MSYYGYREPEPTSNLSPEDRPGFYDLEKNAEVGFVRRAFGRYLTTRNYDRSIKMHTMLGTPLIRKVVMGTAGRMHHSGSGGNYRLEGDKSKIEAATNFAYKGSVFNEVVHAVAALPSAAVVTMDALTNNFDVGAEINIGTFAFNAALVALQRYNRARMIKRVDEELQEGATYRPGYENKFGIDHRAVENYEATVVSSAPDSAMPTPESVVVDVAPPITQTYSAFHQY
ncbi:MAG: hypothetical protein ACHQTE_00425 [Candidatus Saccharimonadales bacterium]